ncbi:hypothetical protein PFICI_12375 [Pestalotiopsis fici W106-1]|uniref:Lipoprotein n=1 Tax=Pestalotiopsis fici (strain W106-1 / CGMCC3.15140) TaxID=1229662 RepID=W3WRH8_PESFW|nr:uncharacterized protein PFICI_12375 [Pestalotiopsis fici W106-1]ETS75431.1 hypothetical protein PFICI_12375 [Pestalotiopsis fici W106-1]
MKTATILLAFISTAWAGCYTTGDDFQNKDNARFNAQRACEGYDGNAGAFQGTFAPGEAKSVCVQGTTTQKYNMVVQNLNLDSSFDLADADCTLRLHNEINGCDKGGESDVAGWHFRVDPNNGIC